MAGYRIVVDVSVVPFDQRRAAARRILRMVERHRPYHKRTGNLRLSAFVELFEDLDLMVVGARADYAPYLVLGTTRGIVGHNWLLEAVNRVLPTASVMRAGLPGVPDWDGMKL